MSNSTSTGFIIHHSNHTQGHKASENVVVDALPYYDSSYDESLGRCILETSDSRKNEQTWVGFVEENYEIECVIAAFNILRQSTKITLAEQ